MAVGDEPIVAAKNATRTVPIVMVACDAVTTGFVESLARPGGNLTGVTCITSELMPKRMAVFRELLPSASRLVVLYNPENVSKPPEAARTVALAKELGLDAKAVQFRTAKTSSAPFPRECSNIAPVSTLFLLERYRAQLNAPKSCARQVRCQSPMRRKPFIITFAACLRRARRRDLIKIHLRRTHIPRPVPAQSSENPARAAWQVGPWGP